MQVLVHYRTICEDKLDLRKLRVTFQTTEFTRSLLKPNVLINYLLKYSGGA